MSVLLQNYIKTTSAVKIAAEIEQAIHSGKLPQGAQLPTIRALATAIGVSPATVSSAYKELRNRGWIQTEGRRGTTVRASAHAATRLFSEVPLGVRNLADGNPDPELLPPINKALAAINPARRIYSKDIKLPRLVSLVTAALGQDGIPSDHIAVTSGALDAIERVLTAQLRTGDRVLVEDPGFPGVIDLVHAMGLKTLPVAIDEFGITPEALSEALDTVAKRSPRRARAEALIVTPRAQNPTGAAFSEKRRRELMAVIKRHPDLLVIEDDHAAGIAGASAISLCAGKRDSKPRRRWALVRSTSKALGPDLRVAILAADSETIARVEGRQFTGMRWVSHILQELVTALWTRPASLRQVEKAEKEYSLRRRALIAALENRGIKCQGRSGINVWIPVALESAAVQGLLEKGWAVGAGDRFRLKSGPGIRVTTATLKPKDAELLAANIATVINTTKTISVA